MKKLGYALIGLLWMTAAQAQELVPDQNPNYMRSAEKYAQQSDALTANQGETVQQTYKAYDWREAKAEKKQNRIDRKYELKKLRIESRNRCCNRGINPYYNYNGWGYNNGFYNNGYNYGYYNNNFLGSPGCNLLYGAGLGLGIYHLFN